MSASSKFTMHLTILRIMPAPVRSRCRPTAGAATASYSQAMNKPASAPDVMPPHERPAPETQDKDEGTNTVQHHPDPEADRRGPQADGEKPRGPYVTGNY
jgi:hypothetical protein